MGKIMHLYDIQWTDTFGGEANYCWVDNDTIEAPNIQSAITKAKQKRYYSPVPRHRVTIDDGDFIRIDIIGANVCCFISERAE